MAEPCPVMLMVRELGIGGSERQLTEIAKALDRGLFRPHVGCLKTHGIRGDELRASGVPVAEFPVTSLLHPSVCGGVWRMGAYFRRHGIRLVHTFDTPMNILAVPAARASGVPVVVSSQRAHRHLASGTARHLLRLTDVLVDAIVVNCQAVRRHLIEEEKVPAGLIELCYNGIDCGRFSPGSGLRPERVADASLVIGAVGALRPEKRLDVLVDACAPVRGIRPGVKLLIVGSGPAADQLETRCRERGFGEAAVFQPTVADVVPWLRAIDVFVLPSASEALSNSLMEAMACGCCVVASRVGGNPELVSHLKTGMLFEPEDTQELAACLRLLIEDEALRRRLAAAAAAFIRENFSIQSSAARLAGIYERLLRNTAAR